MSTGAGDGGMGLRRTTSSAGARLATLTRIQTQLVQPPWVQYGGYKAMDRLFGLDPSKLQITHNDWDYLHDS